MSGISALKALRHAAIANDSIKLYSGDGQDTEHIQEATQVQFGDNEKKYDLDLKTNFYNDNEPQDLKSVVFCWIEEQTQMLITSLKQVNMEYLRLPICKDMT